MNGRLSTLWFALFSLAVTLLTGNAQESERPRRVSTSTGIYDVQSRDEIHKFSASEIRTLVQMENKRGQSTNTFPHPVLVYCFDERTFHYTGGKYQNEEIKYRLHTPKNIRYGRKYPLIVHLHGNGDDSLTHIHPILPMLIGPEQQDFFMLVTQAPRGAERGWYFRSTKDGPLDVLVEIMEHVIAENPIDKKRITATGISGGGWGVWELLLRYPDVFAGAAPTACNAPLQPQRLAALKRTPVWAFINKGDINPESLQSAMRAINSSGGSMAFTECEVPGHNTFRPAAENYNCFLWMLAQKRGSWFAPPPGTVVHNTPRSSLLVFVMYILPLTIIIFLLRGTICEQTSVIVQSMRERLGRN